jgi:aminopeptidase N
VVGHEYFHNWTGNRVTCRDWFQLSLKEGLTVFRDQEFSADMAAATTSRRRPARSSASRTCACCASCSSRGRRPDGASGAPGQLRRDQQLLHVTVYEKGAEVVRMYQTLFGRDGFRKGMDLYFKRHDGQAVTCDDFRHAMADANGRDLAQFERWYSQAGTPRVSVRTAYDAAARLYDHARAGLRRRVAGRARDPARAAADSVRARPDRPRRPRSAAAPRRRSRGVGHDARARIHGRRADLPFVDVAEEPLPSLLRNFSAPVIVEYDYSDDELRSCSRTTATRSTAGKPASAWRARCSRCRARRSERAARARRELHRRVPPRADR